MANSVEARASVGGAFLIGRQLLGLLLNLISVVAITRILGPEKYGIFAIANALAIFAGEVGRLGLDVYLIRQQGDLNERQVQVTQTLYVLIGLGTALAIFGISPVVAHWYHEPELRRVFQAYSVIVPMTLAAGIPMALLDRQLNYRRIAAVELTGQVANVGIAVPIIWAYQSMWGLVAGAFVQSLTVLVSTWYWADVRIRLHWDSREAAAQLRYGCGYAASIWIWQGRNLVNPLVVGMLLGQDAVAYVAMAMRLTAALSFANNAVWRVYMSLLARVAYDRQRMKEAIETGMSFQVIVMGAMFLGFVGVSPELVRGIMGERWFPVLRVFPFIAGAAIVSSGFTLYSSALYVIGAWKDIAVFHIIHVVLFATAAVCLVVVTGDPIGYGWAEVVTCASYYWIRRSMHRRLFEVPERHLYLNMAVTLSAMTLLRAMADSSVWLRVGAMLATASVVVFLAPRSLAILSPLLRGIRRSAR